MTKNDLSQITPEEAAEELRRMEKEAEFVARHDLEDSFNLDEDARGRGIDFVVDGFGGTSDTVYIQLGHNVLHVFLDRKAVKELRDYLSRWLIARHELTDGEYPAL